jgi:predicted methyltransferase
MKRIAFAACVIPLALAACASQPTETASAPAASAAAATPAAPAAPAAAQVSLASVIANPERADAHEVRDRFRNPQATLDFFGLKPGMTVVEASPGSGYWTEILSPYLAKTGGKYIATGRPIASLADQAKWGPQTYVAFSKDSGPLAPAGSADMVLTFRNVHNWMWQDGMLDKAMADFAAALKPGGVLGVEEHRADPRPEATVNGRRAGDGYVSKATIVEAAKKAGLVLEAESEINANPKDTKDHPFGVWTLPPNSRTSGFQGETVKDFDPGVYQRIGESDRMTLRFRKPA